MEGRIIECHSKINGGLDYHNSPLIGEIPTNDYSHYHRSIDQLRSIGMGSAGPQSNGGGGLTYHLHHPTFAEATYPAVNNNNSLERIDYNSGKGTCDLMTTSVDDRTTHISSGSNDRLETETNLKHYQNKKEHHKLYNGNSHHHHQQQQQHNNSHQQQHHHQQQQQHSEMRTTTPSPLTAPILTQDSSSILSPPPSLVQPSAATPPHPSTYSTIVVAHHPSSSLSSSSSSSAHTITTRSSVDGPTKEPKVGGHTCDPRFSRPFCSFAGQQGGAVTAHRHGVMFLILSAVFFFHLPLYVAS
jgi:hypothetical protein